jgi:ABC-type bacteriocin/lantibiotic exporter with double-glycine peptidase domain
MDRLRSAVTSSQLDETILNLPDKLNTRVGERGVQLSGGQRQRIGIARALYKESNILIFDEATNSLDLKTEEAIMETIHKLTSMYTIIIISHRLSTLKNCTAVFEVANGKIFNRGKLGECLQGN